MKTGFPLFWVIAIGTLCGIGALFLHNQIGMLFRYGPIYTIFWFLIGLMLVQLDLEDVPAEETARV